MKRNQEIMILKSDFDYVNKKSDVWLVYTKNNNRPWICCIGGIMEEDEYITLILATKGKSESNG